TKFATEAQVYAVKSAIGSKQDGLPVGTILLFDGAGWRDNATLPGWYSCNRTNYNNGLTPDLEDKFIKGKGALADTGGSNALTAAMLPRHAHSITTTATNKTLTGSIRAVPTDEGAVCSGIISASKWDTEFGYKEEEAPVNQISINAVHEHTGNANNDNSSVTDTNTSNLPLYYSLIYIRRCA
ncbi:MAG: hypothetical protein LBJ25_02870, partial [Candidatus Margulisbacteria bacterium]|nr:hypothetical protein [Candidatus Margulisiibacteriota bacterium]